MCGFDERLVDFGQFNRILSIPAYIFKSQNWILQLQMLYSNSRAPKLAKNLCQMMSWLCWLFWHWLVSFWCTNYPFNKPNKFISYTVHTWRFDFCYSSKTSTTLGYWEPIKHVCCLRVVMLVQLCNAILRSFLMTARKGRRPCCQTEKNTHTQQV